MPLARLLADSIGYAEQGVAVTRSQTKHTADRRAELEAQPGFAQTFLPGGRAPAVAEVFKQPRLAATLRQLAAKGLDDFYRGELARAILNPPLVRLADGRTMVYGSMGGDGQPQTQSAVFTRSIVFGWGAQAAINAPRWLLGRTWGQATETLKLESRFAPEVIEEWRARDHDVEIIGEFDDTVGHAGAIIRHPNGVLEGGADPRSDGAVAAL